MTQSKLPQSGAPLLVLGGPILRGTLGDADADITGVPNGSALYLVNGAALTAPRTYTLADNPGTKPGDQVIVQVAGAYSVPISVVGATTRTLVPQTSGSVVQFLVFQRAAGGGWDFVLGSSSQPAASPPTPPPPEFFASLTGNVNVAPIDLGSVDITTTEDLQAIDVEISCLHDASASGNFDCVIQLEPLGGGAPLQTILAETVDTEMPIWLTRKVRLVTTEPAGDYTVVVSASNASGVAAPTNGGIWVRPVQ